MEEEQLRELATTLLDRLGQVEDDDNRRQATAEIEAALALPTGEAKHALLRALRSSPATRRWVREQTDTDAIDELRVVGLLGRVTGPLGVHVVCPNGDYDKYIESAAEDPGRCPYDGRKLVRAAD
jgi:hypothetical protein